MKTNSGTALSLIKFTAVLLFVLTPRFASAHWPPELYQEYPRPNEPAEFERYAQEIRDIQTAEASGGPIERALHSKAHGCLNGTFKVNSDIVDDAKYGVFVPGAEYPVIGRFSNASGTPKSDKAPDMRGFAMKLALPGGETQDFLMTNGPVHFVKNAKQMMAFGKASSEGWLAVLGFFLGHPQAAIVLAKDTLRHVTSMTTESYWSRTPFKIGPKAMKFNVKPCDGTSQTTMADDSQDTYLTDDLIARSAQGPICFDFRMQFQLDPIAQPIEDASVEWLEEDTPSISVGQVTFPAQSFHSDEQMRACNDLSFSPWHNVPDLRPIGNMNRARKVVYESSASFRGSK